MSTVHLGLRGDLRVILQRRPSGSVHVSCSGFSGVPSERPALIVIVSAPSAAADQSAADLERALRTAIVAGAPSVSCDAVPCEGTIASPLSCHAHTVPACVKALIIVGDAATAVPDDPAFAQWLSGGNDYRVLPLFPACANPSSLLPASVRHLNGQFWTGSAVERVDDVLTACGLTPEDRRVFISYRRQDSLEVAEQLFEELAKQRFDVFVDRFRVPPAVDFQERLTDELAHKSMVLVLESPTLLASQWVEHELTFAKKHELGRFAVLLPGGTRVPWLDDAHRLEIKSAELNPSSATVDGRSRLTAAALTRIVDGVVTEHTRALQRRRGFLFDTMRAALTFHGANDQSVDARGHLHVRVGTPSGSRHYVIWATPRPPDVPDFLVAHGVCAPGPEPLGAVVTAAVFRQATRRRHLEWLAERSLVVLADAGRIDALAAQIAAGSDL